MERKRQAAVDMHPVQLEFFQSQVPYRAFIGGRGSGKSWVACCDLILKAQKGRTYLVVAPTYPMLFDSEFRTFLGIARHLDVVRAVRTSPPHVTLKNGAEVLFRSADDPDRLRGSNLSGVVLLEAAMMPLDVYEIVIACLRENGEAGWLSAGTTPKGTSHWTYQVFGTGRPDTAMFRARTADNPFNPPGFEAQVRRQYGETQFARQELGGEFVQMEGAEWPAEWFDGIFIDRWPAGVVLTVQALDPSKGLRDRPGDDQAHVRLGLIGDGPLKGHLAVECVLRREPDYVGAMLDLARQWKPDMAVVEENATMGLLVPEIDRQVREREAAGVPQQFRYRPKHWTVPKVSRIRMFTGGYLSRRQLHVLDTPGGRALVDQWKDFPLGEHDDAADACASAIWLHDDILAGNAR